MAEGEGLLPSQAALRRNGDSEALLAACLLLLKCRIPQIVTSAASWIASTLVEEAKYLYGVEDVIQNLQSELKHMQRHLQNADAKEALNEYKEDQLQIFTDNIRKLAFRAEDAVDRYIFDVSTKAPTKSSFFKKAACFTIHSWPIHKLRKEADAILEEAKKANERLKRYKGKEATLVTSEASPSRPAIENYILLEDRLEVVGINKDIERFAKQLTSDSDESQVLAIVGEGGAGKSTLAAKLYCHPDVAQRFSCKAHISVSQQWSGSDLLSKIYKQCTGNEKTVEAQEVKDFLKGKRYLIVLDDIWTTDAWGYVSPALPPNKYGRIILTTRNRDLPSHVDQRRTCTVHEPEKLTDDEKWELFSKIAIEGHPFADDEFEQLGKEMLEECDALPLTVVTLAGILQAKLHLDEWERIKKALSERILEGKGAHGYGVARDMVELSYDSLPPQIKLCFLYLAIFPEDWHIDTPELIGMWIAEGFVTEDQLRGEETLEDAARNVVDELARRCMVQISERDHLGKIQEFHMHDIVREFCIAKAKQQHFVEIVSPADKERNNTMEARRVSIRPSGKISAKNQHLRALVQFTDANRGAINLGTIEKFKLLRVLSIWFVGGVLVLPEQIGTLIHLRYFYIGCSVKIPNSIRNLRNLIYFDCWNVMSAPDNIFGQMEKLRHASLFSEGMMSLKRLGVGNLKKLRSLAVDAGEWMIEELPKFDSPIQDLRLGDINRKEGVEAVFECPSVKKDRLSSLGIIITSSEQNRIDLRKLEHCNALRYLNLGGEIGQNGRALGFPSNLVDLTLRYSRVNEGAEDDLMEAIARLSKLRSLGLHDKSYVGKRLSFKAKNAFQKLNELTLDGLPDLEEWNIEEGAMPCVNKIKIYACKSLKSLPENLGSIATLKELVIQVMSEKFCRRYGYGGSEGEDTHIIQHIPSVQFNYIEKDDQ